MGANLAVQGWIGWRETSGCPFQNCRLSGGGARTHLRLPRLSKLGHRRLRTCEAEFPIRARKFVSSGDLAERSVSSQRLRAALLPLSFQSARRVIGLSQTPWKSSCSSEGVRNGEWGYPASRSPAKGPGRL